MPPGGQECMIADAAAGGRGTGDGSNSSGGSPLSAAAAAIVTNAVPAAAPAAAGLVPKPMPADPGEPPAEAPQRAAASPQSPSRRWNLAYIADLQQKTQRLSLECAQQQGNLSSLAAECSTLRALLRLFHVPVV